MRPYCGAKFIGTWVAGIKIFAKKNEKLANIEFNPGPRRKGEKGGVITHISHNTTPCGAAFCHSTSEFVKRREILHHPHGLVIRAFLVVGCVRVLLYEVFFDHCGKLKGKKKAISLCQAGEIGKSRKKYKLFFLFLKPY